MRRFLTPYAQAALAPIPQQAQSLKRILVVVDYQTDFVTGVLGSPNAQAIEDAVCAKVSDYASRGDIVIYTMDTHPADTYGETREGQRVPPHCIPGTEGWELHGKLRGLADETSVFVKKGTYGSSALPKVIEHIVQQGTPVSAIELAGVSSATCVLNNAVILLNFFPELHISVSRAASAAKTDEMHEAALEQLGRFGVEITE